VTSDRILLVAYAGLCVVAAAVPHTLASGAAAFAAVMLLNHANLATFIASALARRLIRQVGFVAPLVALGPPDAALPPWWVWVMCLAPVLVWHALRWRGIAIGLRAAPMFEPVSLAARAAGLAPSALSGITQEYLYRWVLVGGLLPVIGPAPAVAVVTLAFVAEHVFPAHPSVPRGPASIGLWAGMSVLFGAAVAISPGGIWCAMVGHTVLNAPNVVQWLRVPGRTTMAGSHG
jgi:hypothetical protein